jgi:hypothetical protein
MMQGTDVMRCKTTIPWTLLPERSLESNYFLAAVFGSELHQSYILKAITLMDVM